MPKIAPFILAALLLAACGNNVPPSSNEVRLSTSQLTAERGEQDAEAAVERGDFSLVAVRGYSLEVPGVDMPGATASDLYGVREVADTGDVIDGRVTSARNRNARDYARAYNTVIMDRRDP